MDFGLGLVLSFTDNASAGINSAVNSLSQLTQTAENASTSLNQMASLSALSVVSDQLGTSFLKAGNSILSVFTNLLGNVQQTGSDFESFRITLNALYGDATKAENAIAKLLDFSIESPFEVSGVKDMLIVLQSQGIDAFDNITGSITNTKKETLSWISDLMAFKPDEATSRWKRALTNYIGSAQPLMLRNILDMGSIDEILGHEMGTTVAERMNDIVEIVEKKGLTGLSKNLSTTWTGVASNVNDAFTKLYKSIADNGVFDNLKSSLMSVSGAILMLDNTQIEAFGKTVADGLNLILTPVLHVMDKINGLIHTVVDLCQTRPEIMKWGMVFGAIAGVLLVFVGVVLKVTSAFSGLSLMLLTMGKSFSSIGGIIRTGALKMLSTLLPLTATIGLMYLAWKNDFAGIKTNTLYFVNNLASAFNTAKQAVNGSVSDLTNTLSDLNSKDDFFSNLTRGIMKVMMAGEALADAWGDYTLSEENFQKAKELGILPLIEAILDLKYRFGLFKEGFIDGWKEIGDNIKNAVMGFLENVEGTALESLVDNLTEFLQKLASGDAQAWYDFGKSFADFTAKAVAFFIALKGLDKVLGTFAKIATLIGGITKIGGALAKVFSGIGKIFTTVFPWISQIFGGIGEVIALVAGGAGTLPEALQAVFSPLAGIVSLVSGIAMAVTGFVKQLIDGFSWFWEIVKWIGVALGVVGAIILGASALPAVIVGAIIGAVTTLIVVIKDNWAKICEFFSTIGTWIYDNVIKPVADFFVGLWNGIVTGVTTAFNAVKSFLSTIATWIYTNVIQPVVNFFMTYIYPFIEKIVEIVAKIIEIVTVLVGVFVDWINTNVVQPIISFFQNMWNGIVTTFQNVATWFSEKFTQAVNGIKSAFSAVGEFFSGIWNSITSVFANVVTWFSDKFSQAVEAIKSFFSPLAEWFRGVWEKITSVFSKIGTAISDAISGAVKGAINTVLGGAANIINGFISAINSAIGAINKIPGVDIGKLSPLSVPALATGGVVENPTLAMIGEAGKEAVMPLENNTGWIGKLASMIATQMTGGITPTNSHITNTTNEGSNNQKYLTSSTTNNQTVQGNTDNSVVFSEGAIQVTVQNATEEEAIRLAKKVMEYIKRQKELDAMLNYG